MFLMMKPVFFQRPYGPLSSHKLNFLLGYCLLMILTNVHNYLILYLQIFI